MHQQFWPLLKTKDLAQIFQVSPKTIRAWHGQGKLRGRRIGRALRFTVQEVERVIEASSALMRSDETPDLARHMTVKEQG
jgi:predicted site-specific integrase-resolvase